MAKSTNFMNWLKGSEVVNQYGMARQAIIDGNFQICQTNPVVGTEITNPGGWSYPCFDLWRVQVDPDAGTFPTVKHSQQLITPGSVDRSKFCYRINVNGAGTSLGANSIYSLMYHVEHGVQNLCGLGKTLTVSFWARSTITNKRIGMRFFQIYGTGGSPSGVSGINGSNWTLTSTWAKCTYTFTTTTLVGKTFGTANDDLFRIDLLCQWGSNFASGVGASTAETFVGSGDIEIAQMQLCTGDVALPFEPKSFNDELQTCQRYYEKSYDYNVAPGATSILGAHGFEIRTTSANCYDFLPCVRFQVQKKSTPAVYCFSTTGASGTGAAGKVRDVSNAVDRTVAIDGIGFTGFFLYLNNQNVTAGSDVYWQWTADARF
jgi:hypothetical protein